MSAAAIPYCHAKRAYVDNKVPALLDGALSLATGGDKRWTATSERALKAHARAARHGTARQLGSSQNHRVSASITSEELLTFREFGVSAQTISDVIALRQA